MALTHNDILRAKPREKPFKLSDAEGLYLHVTPKGKKTWRMRYRFQDRDGTLSFGSFPGVTLKKARELREKVRVMIREGEDPAEEFGRRRTALARRASPREPVASNSFKLVAREWWEVQNARWKPSYASRILSRLEDDVFPELGARPIDQIEPPEVLEVLRKVEDRGAIEMAKRIRQAISGVFRYAIATGKASRDPSNDIVGALRPKPRPKRRAALKAGELTDFFSKLAVYDGEEQTALGVEFVMHTVVRTSEARFARWGEFDLKGARPMWRIPAERMKIEREHLVPLTPRVVEILKRLKELNAPSTGTNDFVFPGDYQGVISENTLLYALYRMGYHKRATIHGFRGTFSTIANESGKWQSDWIERQLAHVEGNQVRAAYNAAEWLDQRTRLMTWWSKYLERQKRTGKLLS